jgi:hypothetical protein
MRGFSLEAINNASKSIETAYNIIVFINMASGNASGKLSK